MKLRSYQKAKELYESGDLDGLRKLASLAGGIDKPCLTDNRTILHLCSATTPKDPLVFNKLAEHFPITHPNCEDDEKHTPLDLACIARDEIAVEFLTSHGADPNHQHQKWNAEKEDPLFSLCGCPFSNNAAKWNECVRTLIKAGASKTPLLGKKRTHLAEAIENNLFNIADILLTSDFPVFPYQRKTDSSSATRSSHVWKDISLSELVEHIAKSKSVSKDFIKNLANYSEDMKNAFSSTKIQGDPFPVFLALRGRSGEVEGILEAGIKLPFDIINKTALSNMSSSVSGTLKVLFSHGYTIQSDLFGNSILPAFYEASHGKPDLDTVYILMTNGADIFSPDPTGEPIYKQMRRNFSEAKGKGEYISKLDAILLKNRATSGISSTRNTKGL